MPGVRLTADQRLVIERAYMAGLPQATIAALVGKHPSTISRELRRNAATRAGTVEYRATVAQWKAQMAAKEAERLAKEVLQKDPNHIEGHILLASVRTSQKRWDEARAVIERYNILYIFIGNLERTSMRVSEEKFAMYLKPIFQQGSTVIYEAP